jgi:hypothetical protein
VGLVAEVHASLEKLTHGKFWQSHEIVSFSG